MAIGSRDPRLQWFAAILVSTVPFVMFALLARAYVLPADVAPNVVSLRGSWKVLPADRADGARVDADDRGAKTVKLPGGWEEQGFATHETWLRRTVTWPASEPPGDAMVVLGAMGGGSAEIFVNGQKVGNVQSAAVGLKADIADVEGSSVPRGLLHPGENVIALRVSWPVLGDDGINDPRMWLGPEDSLAAYLFAAFKLKLAFHTAALALFGMLLVLLLTFLVSEEDPLRRARQVNGFQVIVFTFAYVCLNSGTFIHFPESSPRYMPFVSLLIFGMLVFVSEFMEGFHLQKRSRALRAQRWILGAMSAAMVVFLVMGSQRTAKLALEVYNCFVPIFAASSIWMLVVSIYGLFHTRRPVDLIVGVAVVSTVIAGFTDVLVDFQVLQAPRLYTVMASNLAVLVGIIVVADFVKIATDNKTLSARLALQNEALGEALHRAQEVADLKGQLLANMSHELRTPLNTIINVPEALLSQLTPGRVAACSHCGQRFELEAGEALDATTPCPGCQALGTLSMPPATGLERPEELPSLLSAVLRNGRHLMRLIDEVLNFSKLDARRLTLKTERLDAGPWTRGLAEELAPLGLPRGITLRLEQVAEGSLEADPLKLRQVVTNLVGNAVKFSPDGGRVVLTVNNEERGFHFAVRDQGIGIASEHHALIFESFQRVDSSHTREHGGFGLGLAITKGLVEMHGGRIWVESALGQGSTFHVWVPERPPEAASSVTPDAASSAPKEAA